MNSKRCQWAALAIAALGAGCIQDTVLEESTMTTLDSTGGIARSADERLELRFPTGALKNSTDITITTRRDLTFPRTKTPVYDLGPDGIQFDRKVMFRVTGLVSEVELMVAQIDGQHAYRLPSSNWNASTGEITAELEHFSSYAVLTVYNPCGGATCGDACVVCDPLDPTCVEPPPASKACNQSGLCVDSALPMCSTPPPPRDGGVTTTPDAGTTPDGGSTPDGGIGSDAGNPPDAGMTYCSDFATQRPKPLVDLLLVIDTSCSMAEEQAALASEFPTLLDTLVQNNADFHIGTTKMEVGPTGSQGALQGTVPVLTSTTPNLAAEFTSNVVLGTGSGGSAQDESGLHAMELSLAHPSAAALHRPGASLTVILISDEPEQSAFAWEDHVDAALAFKGPYGDRRLQINAIAGDMPSGCNGPNGSASAGPRYIAAAQATGGVFNSICAASYATALTDLGEMSYGYEFVFGLSMVPTSTASLEVLVDGVPVNAGPATGWSYDAALNSIVFAEFGVPDPSSNIEIRYDCP